MLDFNSDNGVPQEPHPPPQFRVTMYTAERGEAKVLWMRVMSMEQAIIVLSTWMTEQACHGLIPSPRGMLKANEVLVALQGVPHGQEA